MIMFLLLYGGFFIALSGAQEDGENVQSQIMIGKSKRKSPRPSQVLISPVQGKKLDFVTEHGLPVPFFSGERFLYSVSWFALEAGFVEITVQKNVRIKEHETFHFVARAWTSDFFSRFFKVNDRIETWLDTTRFIPRRYEEHIHEGSYSKNRVFEFFHGQRTIIYDQEKFAISAQAQDPFSCFMLLRMLHFSPGDTISIDVFSNRQCYQIDMAISPVQQRKTKLGTFPCFSVKPTLKQRGRVLQENSELLLWFTADEKRLPVLIETKAKIGTITAQLIDMTPLKFEDNQ